MPQNIQKFIATPAFTPIFAVGKEGAQLAYITPAFF
jgi:hypothetical protein